MHPMSEYIMSGIPCNSQQRTAFYSGSRGIKKRPHAAGMAYIRPFIGIPFIESSYDKCQKMLLFDEHRIPE